jgi:hypothetical protein
MAYGIEYKCEYKEVIPAAKMYGTRWNYVAHRPANLHNIGCQCFDRYKRIQRKPWLLPGSNSNNHSLPDSTRDSQDN